MMENILKQLLSVTAWEMTAPKPYGVFHLLVLAVGLPLCWWAARTLAGRERGTGDGVLLGVGLFLAVTELYKQLFHYYIVNDSSYNWAIFPFQLCSVPMYLCLLVPFLRSQRLKQVVYDFMFTYNLLGGIMALLVPPGLCHEYWTLTLHGFVWHLLLVFLGLYLGMSGRALGSRAGFRASTALFLLLCLTAFFINLTFWEVSEGTINMFYIGPKDSPQLVFKTIAEHFGWYTATALYIPSISVGAYLVLRICKKWLRVCRETVNV